MDDSFLLLFNAHYEAIEFMIPPGLKQWEWSAIIDTTKPRFVERGKLYRGELSIPVEQRSLVALQKR
jgi:glycogen operon protein